MKTVYIALGSNLGVREDSLQRALNELQSRELELRRVSPVYETDPMYLESQPRFLNAVVEATTALFPLQLLQRLQSVEVHLRRKRAIRNGPRTIDLDLLLYGDLVMQSERLTVPHPKMAERRFVLQPLVDLAPELAHPVSRRTMRELLREVPDQRLERTGILLEVPESAQDRMLH